MNTAEVISATKDVLPMALSIALPTWIYKVLKPQITELKNEIAEVKKDKEKWYLRYTSLIATLIKTSNKTKCHDCKMLEAFQEHLKDEEK